MSDEVERRIAAKRARLISTAVESGWDRADAEQFADDARALIEGRLDPINTLLAFKRMDETVEKYKP